MSHISKQEIKGCEKVHPAVLREGLKVAAQILALQGASITDYVFDWSGNKVTQFNGVTLICGIAAEGAVNAHKFGGVGLAVDKDGKLAIVGDFYYNDQRSRRDQLRKQLEKVLGGACYFAARAMIARAKGQKTQVRVNQESRQLELVVSL